MSMAQNIEFELVRHSKTTRGGEGSILILTPLIEKGLGWKEVNSNISNTREQDVLLAGLAFKKH